MFISNHLRSLGVVKTACAMLFSSVILASHSDAAVIIWQTPVNVDLTNPSQVLNNGDYVSAGSLYPEYWAPGALVVNGVNFLAMDNAGFTSVNDGGGFIFGNQAGADTNYNNAISGILYENSTGAALTPSVIKGLTIGQTYQLQLWVGFFSSNLQTRFSSTQPTGSPTALSAPDQSAALNVGNVGNTGPISQFVVGTFIADGTTQNLYTFADSGSTGLLSAYSLQAVPEPSTVALAAIGVSAVLFRLRRKQRAI